MENLSFVFTLTLGHYKSGNPTNKSIEKPTLSHENNMPTHEIIVNELHRKYQDHNRFNTQLYALKNKSPWSRPQTHETTNKKIEEKNQLTQRKISKGAAVIDNHASKNESQSIVSGERIISNKASKSKIHKFFGAKEYINRNEPPSTGHLEKNEQIKSKYLGQKNANMLTRYIATTQLNSRSLEEKLLNASNIQGNKQSENDIETGKNKELILAYENKNLISSDATHSDYQNNTPTERHLRINAIPRTIIKKTDEASSAPNQENILTNTLSFMENKETNPFRKFEKDHSILINACNNEKDIFNLKPSTASKCLIYSDILNTCEKSSEYYPENSLKGIKGCKGKLHSEICEFIEISQKSTVFSGFHLKCNSNLCMKNSLEVAVMNQKKGKLSRLKINNIVSLKSSLTENRENKLFPNNFVFLSCRREKDGNKIEQLLYFPPFISLLDKPEEKAKLNINIITLDSVSRQHFYRMLPNTIKSMRLINKDNRYPTEILDFKAFQSLAPFTFVNLEALLSGHVTYENKKKRHYAIDNLFGIFKKLGYQTLLQEESCWYDQWGSILTGNRNIRVNSRADKDIVWKEISNLTRNSFIDNLGLTHMSCDVLEKYGTTNLFNIEKYVCFNGKPMSVYFIQYALDQLKTREKIKNSKPIFSYTHLNFAHETTGIRVRALDDYLDMFMKDFSQLENTITVLWSDHGGKTDKYSINELTGRFETYDPILFMVIPKTLQRFIGEEKYQNLIENQNSLVHVIDMRTSLLNFVRKSKTNLLQKFPDDMTSPLLKLRSNCSIFPGRKYSLCKCVNKLKFKNIYDQNNLNFLTWLGEYAIGYLNIMVSSQQTGLESYRCTRLIGSGFRNLVTKSTSKGIIWIFDVVINFNKRQEIFNFQILFNKNRVFDLDTLTLEKWLRISLYNTFSHCKDPDVTTELCLCSKNTRSNISHEQLLNYRQFNQKSIIKPIFNSECMFLVTRNHSNMVVALEIANLCQSDLTIEFNTDILYSWEISENLPIRKTIPSSKIMFIATFFKTLSYKEEIKPVIIIK